MNEQHQWRELAQQLRVDSIRSSTAAGSGHPTSSMSAADLMAVLSARHLRYDWATRRPGERPPDLLQGPRVAPAVLDLQGGGVVSDDELMTATAGSGRLEGHPTPGCPGWTSPPARSARACPTASASRSPASTWTGCRTGCGCCAATARWPRARCGRPSTRRRTTSWPTWSRSST